MNDTRTKVDVRTRLMETASELFYGKGYIATGINEIIKQAKVAKASFYHHFKTKEDLLIATLERRHDRMMAELRGVVSQGRTPLEKVGSVFEWLGKATTVGGNSMQGCAYLNVATEFRDASGRVRELVKWHKSSFRQFLKELITAHFRGGNQSEDEIDALTDDVYLLAEGVFAATFVHGGTWPAKSAWRVVQARLNAESG